MGNLFNINGKALRQARKKRSLTQQELAELSAINKDSISRLERGQVKEGVRRHTLDSLCKALHVGAATLAGETADPATKPERGKNQMNVRVSDSTRFAYALVAKRYKVTREQILATAPLLFFIAAEQSFKTRREALKDVKEAAVRLENVYTGISHLTGFQPEPVWDSIESEEKSIEGRDLFGTIAEEKSDLSPGWFDEHNPFAEFLRNALEKVSGTARLEEWPSYGEPRYRICIEEVEEYVGGDRDAVEALLNGVVALQGMPKDVGKAGPEARATWIKAKAKEAAAEADRFFKDLGINLAELPDASPSVDRPEGQ